MDYMHTYHTRYNIPHTRLATSPWWCSSAHVSPPHRGGAVPYPLPRDRPECRDKFSEESDHLLPPNRGF